MEPNPQPQKKPFDKYKELDPIAARLKNEAGVHLLLLDGRRLRDEILGKDRYCFFLKEKLSLQKVACIGAFPDDCDPLIMTKDHPVRGVPANPTERFNHQKLQELYPEHRKGHQLKVVLVNGWELVGQIEEAGQFYLGLRLNESKVAHLYRHALADYDWPDGAPALSEEEIQKTKHQRKDLAYKRPKKKAAKAQKQPIQNTQPTAPTNPPKAFWEALKEEVKRTMVNAKLKITLREIPETAQELGDIIWVPLQNQPNGLPKGIELTQMSIDLVVPKKIWGTAQKKAEDLKKQTGLAPIYVFEALVGMYQNRFAAVASGIQVVEGKPGSKA